MGREREGGERKNKDGCEREKWAKVRREKVEEGQAGPWGEMESRVQKAAAWTLSLSMREMSPSQPEPSLLGNTAAASWRGRDD